MIIKLSPQVREGQLSVNKRSDVLTINGERFDFRALPDGAVLPGAAVDCEYVVGPVSRIDGVLVLTLLLPISAEAGPAARFPSDIVNPPDGNVSFPE